MGFHEDSLVNTICEIYVDISRLESLKPSVDVNILFTKLVLTCIPPCSIDVNKLSKGVQETRAKLIKLCGEAQGHLESHFSEIMASNSQPLEKLTIFPYYSNYLKLSLLELNIMSEYNTKVPNSMAFMGSGPLPLTSIASRLIDSIDKLGDYNVVFLAALVGMDKHEKMKVVSHLSKHMAPNSILMLRSAHGARAFLYPVVDPCELHGFEVLSVYHPTYSNNNKYASVGGRNERPCLHQTHTHILTI
ncbi:unnamed protein product [Victoria cruziana]